jgi:hypothetical protein
MVFDDPQGDSDPKPIVGNDDVNSDPIRQGASSVSEKALTPEG